MVLITLLALVAFVLSWGSLCAVYFNLPDRREELRDIRRRLSALEAENTQLRIRVGEHELYPTVFEAEASEREQLSLQIGTKQVFGISKERSGKKAVKERDTMPHFMGEPAPTDGFHFDLSIWTKKAPLVCLIIGKVTLLTALTIVETCIAAFLPYWLQSMGVIGKDTAQGLFRILAIFLVVASYVVAGVVWGHYAYSDEEIANRARRRESSDNLSKWDNRKIS